MPIFFRCYLLFPFFLLHKTNVVCHVEKISLSCFALSFIFSFSFFLFGSSYVRYYSKRRTYLIGVFALIINCDNSTEIAVGQVMNIWMEDLRFYVLFNSIPIVSGRWADDNERLCANEPCLRLRRFRLERALTVNPAVGWGLVGWGQVK